MNSTNRGAIGLLLILCCNSALARDPEFFVYLTSDSRRPSLVAYAPTGLDLRHSKRPAPASIESDVAALERGFDGLILYGYDELITPHIVQAAVRRGFRSVVLGVWDPRSEVELAGAAALALGQIGNLATAVCLGNEGITMGRYSEEDLINAVRRMRSLLGPRSRIPICTSEPIAAYGEAWLRAVGDFLAPNIHAVFDRADLRGDPRQAATWSRARGKALAIAAKRPVLVKECGFPHGGGSDFSLASQRQFWREYTRGASFEHVASTAWVSYAAAFEAFDQPVKAETSGLSIEGHWGFFDSHRRPHPAFSVWRSLRRNPTLTGD